MAATIYQDMINEATSAPRDRKTQNRLSDNDVEVIGILRGSGKSAKEVAEMLHIHRSTVYRAMDRQRKR